MVSEAIAASATSKPSDKRIDDLEALVKTLSSRIEKLEKGVGDYHAPDSISRRLENLERSMGTSFGSAGWDSVSRRLDKLEEKVGR